MISIPRRRLLLSAAAAAGYLAIPRTWLQAREGEKVEKKLKWHTESPRNGEPALEELVKSHITPVSHFYVRNHGPIPEVDVRSHRLTIEGLVHKPFSISLDELRAKFPEQDTEATLTCAGNRRDEMSAIKKIGGVPWNAGAIGNANWSGALLADLLKAAELKEGAKHVWFEGLDPIKEKDGSEAPFGGSIPLEKALATDGGQATLIAWIMNRDLLTPEHGFPLRMIVPGFIGARSVKWLRKIVVSDRPSPNHYVAEAYKIVKTDDKAEVAAAEPIYEFAINSAICIPSPSAKASGGKITITGYALPAGDPKSAIEKVELSLDGGATWLNAKLPGEAKPLVWRLWSLEVPLPPATKFLLVRATDSQGNVQPETTPWNFKGYMQNAWHKVAIG